ncbi:hypothetical protein EAH79_06100 [Sphingomonas koreensis]|nr:hypothetical protein EAH79_06100 [Sphingomonas koreensis]
MFRTLVALSLLAAPGALMAQSSSNTRTLAQAQAAAPDAADPAPEVAAAANKPPQRVRSVTVVGTQACPKSTSDEIVVCSRVDRDDQYRIPPKLREAPKHAANNSWVNRAAMIDQVGREAGGLPDTCSVVGSGGQTGCSQQAMRQYSAEKRQQQREQDALP